MEIKDILKRCDYTLLSRTATMCDIRALISDGEKYNVASICIPPCFVSFAAKVGTVPVCTVIGFPNGYNGSVVKVFEAERAIGDGASEIDAVINCCRVKEGDFGMIESEIAAIKKVCGSRILKIIIETGLLTTEEKIKLCSVVYNGGADFIKTSTGFIPEGATIEDVELMRKFSPPSLKIKAAGGIRTLEQAEAFIEAGADRIGTSKLIAEVKAKEGL